MPGGTFVVVAIDELIELGLLLEEVAGRRLLEAVWGKRAKDGDPR